MPALLAAQGFIVQVDLFPTLSPPAAARFDLLRGLPLTSLERQVVDKADTASVHLRGVWEQVVHLPFFLITAVRP